MTSSLPFPVLVSSCLRRYRYRKAYVKKNWHIWNAIICAPQAKIFWGTHTCNWQKSHRCASTFHTDWESYFYVTRREKPDLYVTSEIVHFIVTPKCHKTNWPIFLSRWNVLYICHAIHTPAPQMRTPLSNVASNTKEAVPVCQQQENTQPALIRRKSTSGLLWINIVINYS